MSDTTTMGQGELFVHDNLDLIVDVLNCVQDSDGKLTDVQSVDLSKIQLLLQQIRSNFESALPSARERDRVSDSLSSISSHLESVESKLSDMGDITVNVKSSRTQLNSLSSSLTDLTTTLTEVKNNMVNRRDIGDLQYLCNTLNSSVKILDSINGANIDGYAETIRTLTEYGYDRTAWLQKHGSLSEYYRRAQTTYRFRGLVALDVAYAYSCAQMADVLSEMGTGRDTVLAAISQTASAVKSLQAAALNVEAKYHEALIEAAGLNEQISSAASLAIQLKDINERFQTSLPSFEAATAILQQRIVVDTQTKDALRSLADQAPGMASTLIRLLDVITVVKPIEAVNYATKSIKTGVDTVAVVHDMKKETKTLL